MDDLGYFHPDQQELEVFVTHCDDPHHFYCNLVGKEGLCVMCSVCAWLICWRFDLSMFVLRDTCSIMQDMGKQPVLFVV